MYAVPYPTFLIPTGPVFMFYDQDFMNSKTFYVVIDIEHLGYDHNTSMLKVKDHFWTKV